MALMSIGMKVAREAIDNLLSGWNYIRHHDVVVGAIGEHANLLYLHEAGVPARHIPPRPVLQPALGEAKTKRAMSRCYRKAIFRAIVAGDESGAEAELNKMGMIGRDACKKYITDGNHLAPNSPVTIAKKGSSIPLIDTGVMLNSITYEIREK